jgi:hypothetical protein
MVDYLPTQVLVLVASAINLVLVLRAIRTHRLFAAEMVPLALWIISLLAFYGVQIYARLFCPLPLLSPQTFTIWSMTLRLQG